MTDWKPYTDRAKAWFESLRDAICAEFEAIELEAGSDAKFAYMPWQRDAVEGGGGETGSSSDRRGLTGSARTPVYLSAAAIPRALIRPMDGMSTLIPGSDRGTSHPLDVLTIRLSPFRLILAGVKGSS